MAAAAASSSATAYRCDSPAHPPPTSSARRTAAISSSSHLRFHPLPLLLSPSRLPFPPSPRSFPALPPPRSMSKDTIVEEKLGVRVERNPPESRLTQLGVRSWPKWGCPPSKFPWTYSGTETCYLLKGKVKVYGENTSEYIEIGAGDLVIFPDGMSCTWEVFETVDKHYSFS